MSEERPTRRRAGVLEQAIREATAAELADHGYTGVTFEGVARRARTSKPVLYRRYTSRAHLVIDAWSGLAPLDLPEVDHGSLRDDLLAALSAVTERFQRIGVETFRRVIAEADDELLAEISTFTWSVADEAITRILSAARDRGELGDAPIPQRVALLPLVLVRHELFFSRDSLTPQTLTDMVDQVCLPLLVSTSRGGAAR